jgi:hypothetical protein
MAKERAVLVTTAHRGVFFGYAAKTSGKNVILKRCRNVVFWSSDVRGFLGLAATGPTKSCRIGPAAPTFDCRDVTSVTDVTPEAVTAFEAGPWA